MKRRADLVAPGGRILWVAPARPHEHLARAHLARALLGRHGVAVDVAALSGRRTLFDLGDLLRRARAADLVVSDSLHPALLVAPLLAGRALCVVYLYDPRALPGAWAGRAVRALFARAFARVEIGAPAGAHGEPPPPGAPVLRLPPLVAGAAEAQARWTLVMIELLLGARRR